MKGRMILKMDVVFDDTNIFKAAKKAKELANENDCNISFKFNGVNIVVKPGADYFKAVELIIKAKKGEAITV